jgi:tetratricopeptide (TPR) repeat protein
MQLGTSIQRSAGVALAMLALLAVSCAQKAVQDKIPVTTSSEEARKAYFEGRELADNLRLTNSIEHFDRAIALDPDFALAYLNRAGVSGTAKEFFANLNKAVALAGKASEGERLLILATEAGASANSSKQKELLEKLVTAWPKDERARFALGGYYFGQQEYAMAIEQYQRAIELSPNFPPVYNILGYAYRQVENYPEAEKTFKKYTELIPQDPNPYDSYAELLLKMGKFDQSIEYYQKALAADPKFMASYSGLAMDYMHKGMSAEASSVLKKQGECARNEGEERIVLFGQTVLYADAGQLDQALRVMDQQYAMAEKSNDPAQMTADLGFRGNILVEMGKFDDASAAFRKALEVTDKSDLSEAVKENTRLFSHFNAVAPALGKKDLKTAHAEAEVFRKGAEATKNLNQVRFAHDLAGMIALAEKDYGKAVTELTQSNQQNPYNLYRLSLAYQGLGDKAKAKELSSKAANFNGLPGLNYAFVRNRAAKMALGS